MIDDTVPCDGGAVRWWCGASVCARSPARRSASCAPQVSTAFDSVFGGIIFSMETTASYFELSSYWNALYCALWGSICMRLWGQTGLFPTAETLTSAWGQYELLEMPIFLLLGGACGLCGALFVRLNEAHQAWRMRHGLHKKLWYSHVAYPLLVSFMTATVCFPEFLGGFMPHGTGTITRLVTLSNLEVYSSPPSPQIQETPPPWTPRVHPKKPIRMQKPPPPLLFSTGRWRVARATLPPASHFPSFERWGTASGSLPEEQTMWRWSVLRVLVSAQRATGRSVANVVKY